MILKYVEGGKIEDKAFDTHRVATIEAIYCLEVQSAAISSRCGGSVDAVMGMNRSAQNNNIVENRQDGPMVSLIPFRDRRRHT